MFVKPNAYKLLKQKRQEVGMSGAELGRRMGLKSAQHYWNLENNRNRFTLEYAFAAAKALHVNIDFFCTNVKLNV